MTPEICQVKHDPGAGTYGDCLRACVASLLDEDADAVPHFYHDNCDGPTGHARLSEFLSHRDYVPFMVAFTGLYSRADILAHMEMQNPTAHYLLFGSLADGGQHVVVCRGGRVVHDPSWVAQPLVGPADQGVWVVMVLARA